MPLSASVIEPAASVLLPLPLSGHRGTALLVDDDELVRMSTADMRADLGYQVVEASSAEEARLDAIDMVERAGFEPIEAMSVEDAIAISARRADIRVVYMDLDMPRGVRVSRLRPPSATAALHWIILTAASFAKADLTLPVRAEFYAKPVRRREIVAAMRRITASAST